MAPRLTRTRHTLAATAAACLALAACGQAGEPDPGGPTPLADGGTLTASPLEPTETSEPTPEPTTAEEPTEAEEPTDDDTSETDGEATDGEPSDGEPEDDDGDGASDEPAGPTDADRARFVGAYRPADAAELQHVATDTTGNGDRELVFVWVGEVSGRSHVALASWDGEAYDVGWQGEGGPADQLGRVRVADVNADGQAEVVVVERRNGQRASASVWSVAAPASVQPLVAEGGCHDGLATFGVAGVSFVAGADGAEEIHATCDESPLPPESWREEVYVWSDGAYRARDDAA